MKGIESKVMVYRLKEDTSTSYYLISGEHLLPERVSITLDEFQPIQSQRLPELKVGQLKAKFRKNEFSPYNFGNGCIHTTIWKSGVKSSSSTLLGTGDLKNTNALLVFHHLEPNVIQITLYPMGKFSKHLLII